MLFREKVGLLLSELGVPNAALSRASELDVSLISRFRSGERVPSRFSPQLDKLAKGAARLALQCNKAAQLCRLCGAPEFEDEKMLFDAILAWINAEDSMLRPKRAHSGVVKIEHPAVDSAIPRAFAETLSHFMSILNISDTQLANALDLDTQLISRYRNGVRKPDIGGRIASRISTYFSELPLKKEERSAICAAAGIEYTESPQVLYCALHRLLHPQSYDTDKVLLDNVLARLDEQGERTPQIEAHPFVYIDGEYSPATSHYTGGHGLRNATLRLLHEANSDEKLEEIVIYTDHPLTLQPGEELFSDIVLENLLALLNRGVRIRVIHDINRSPVEIMRQFEKWMPLYMTGLVSTYFCRRPQDARFCNTIVIVGHRAAMHSSCVAAAMPYAQYCFTKSPDMIKSLRSQFAALLRDSSPLARIFLPSDQEAYFSRLAQFERASGDADVLLSSLSFYTLPNALLRRMLSRAQVNDADAKKLIEYHMLSVQRARRNLALYHVTDYIAMPTQAQFTSGQVLVSLGEFLPLGGLSYTPEDYLEHIASMKKLMRQNPNYEVRLLPEKPFSALTVAIRQGEGVYLRKSQHPCVSFFLNHPLMYACFKEFFNSLKERSRRIRLENGGDFQLPVFMQKK